MSKIIDNIKGFLFSNRKRTIITVFALLLVSFGIGYFVFAEDDPYKDKMTITNTSVSIVDGTVNNDGNIDTCTGVNGQCLAGEDNSLNNKIVRNFDSIIYKVAFKLDYKESYTGDKSDSLTRNVDIHIYIPRGVYSAISSDIEGDHVDPNDQPDETIDGYDHFVIHRDKININNTPEQNTTSINVSIVSKNGDKILPIIKVKESTDTTKFSDIPDVLTSGDTVTVTAEENYAIKLYPGTVNKDEANDTSEIPVGVLLYLPKDANKGIKGIQVPKEISFNMDIKYTKGEGAIYTNSSISDYKENIGLNVPNLEFEYTEDISNASSKDLPSDEGTSAKREIKYQNIKYHTVNNEINLNEGIEGADKDMVIYLSSKVFVVQVERNGKIDTTLSFTATNGVKTLSNTILIDDNYDPFVGEYLSKIDFINENNISINPGEEIQYTTPGQAMYNYNEEFYIQDTITYAEKSGDVLEKGLTNYIKVDPDLIKLVDVGNINNEDLDYYIEIEKKGNNDQNTNTSGDDVPFNVSYGVGEWTKSNFEIKDGAPKYCPTSVPTDKDQLMNLYGGPCIKEKDNTIKWYNSISDAASVQAEDKIILFKFDFTDKYYNATETRIRLKGKIVSNIDNVGTTTQVVSRGTTIFDNEIYYLSETSQRDLKNVSDNPYPNYIKSTYDLTNKVFNDGTNLPSGKYGNSILITPFKSTIGSTIITDSNDSEKNTIFSGITDPLSIKINPVIYKSDSNAAFTSAAVTVYLPAELELDIQKNDKIPISTMPTQETIDGKLYNKYTYQYTDANEDEVEELKKGIIKTLVLHAYIDISTTDNTEVNVISVIDANMKTNRNAVENFDSITPVETRTYKTPITLRNTKVIGTLGKVSPSFFEKNGVMTYNMRAANISGKAADLTLLKILPYNGDGLGDGTSYNGSISVKINENLPEGYTVYYTKTSANTIISNELNSSSLNGWNQWTNYTSNISGITAIKITAPEISNNGYFASRSGINITMTTSENSDGDEYNNNFYILQKGIINCENELEGGCSSSTTSNSTTPYASNISYSSVYNRSISGYAFEDYDYDGLYSSGENRLKDIPVEVYKLSATQFDSKDPINAISNNDELVAETTTDKNGSYKVKGLAQGNYYVKYTFDCEKYTVTEKNKQAQVNSGDTSQIDSDASMVANTCSAVSNIITLNNEKTEAENIDLGLRIRQNFDVTIKKYITNVTVNSTKGTTSYDYDNETKVKIDVKNLKNTSFRVTYKFVIENSKYFPGTIGQIVESIPDGMTFDPTLPENDGWYMSDNFLYYTKYSKTYILPDEKYYMTVVLDLKTDNGGDYINVIAAQDLKIMDTTLNLLEGVQIADYNSALDTNNTKEQ